MTLRVDFNLIFRFFCCVYISASTMFFVPARPEITDQLSYAYDIQELFFRYGAILIVCLSSFLKQKRSVNFISFASLIVYLLIVSSFKGMEFWHRRAILNMFVAFMLYKAIVENFDDKDTKAIAWSIAITMLIHLFMAVLQYFKLDPIFMPIDISKTTLIEPCGFMRLKAHLGTFAVMGTGFLFLIHPLMSLLAVPLLWFSDSSASVGAYVIMMWFMISKRYGFKRVIMFASPLLILGGLYVIYHDMPGGNFGYRFKVWLMMLNPLYVNGLFFGMGIGSFALWSPQTAQLTNPDMLSWTWAHNDIYQLLWEVGIFGFVPFVLWCKHRASEFRYNSEDRETQALGAGVLGLFIISLFHFPFHIGRLAVTAIFVMACYQAKTEAKKLEVFNGV